MGDTAILFENVGKQYRLGTIGTGTLSHDIKRWWILNVEKKEDPYLKIGFTPKSKISDNYDAIWALKDINLQIIKGEILGIIGKNGAGKSTLLKILSRVTAPTSGCIKANGRIASLLEVGTGFHPEMTGRENIFMNGAIMGMTKKEIKNKLDEIIDFAGIDRYVDTPVKRYSSGMIVRLGFAVAAHLEPEILVVDEVLAVGDAEFQKKAIGKMQSISKGNGRTVLFVSHNMISIQNLCKKGILLEKGRLIDAGEIGNVINTYLSKNLATNEKSLVKDLRDENRSKGSLKVIEECWIENNQGTIVNAISMGEAFSIKFKFNSAIHINNALFGFGIENDQGQRITSMNNEISGNNIPSKISKGIAECKLENPNLIAGLYFISISVVTNQIEWVDYIERAISFEIAPKDIYNSGKLITKSQGSVYLKGGVNVYPL